MSPNRLHKAPFAMYGLLLAVLLMASLAGCTGTLSLAPYSIAGRITRASDGNGLGEIIVQVNGASNVATTSKDGNWSMSGLTGVVTVTPAGGQGWVFTPSAKTIWRSANDVDFIAVPTTYSASGRVYDDLGNPIRLVVIEASGRPGIAMTNADGVWAWDGLSGTTILTAEAHGWTFSPSSHVVDGPASGVDFVGSPKVITYSVSGRVTDKVGNPIGGALITFSGFAGGIVTKPDGTWSKSGLSGSVTITASHDDWVLSPSPCIVDGPRSDVDFVGSPITYSVSGRVYDTLGNPIRWAVIDAGRYFGFAIPNSRGVWTLNGLLGTITLTVSATGYTFSPSSRVVNGPASDVDFVGSFGANRR